MESSELPRNLAGTTLGERYELVRPLARGGMGHVWVGRHAMLDRLVAVKFVEKASAAHDQRLLSEARMLARLHHPNVVQVFDCGTDDGGRPFIVMELLEGPTLAAYLDDHGALGAVAATRLLLPMLDGLSAVHEAALIHRDLKPDNVVLVSSNGQLVPKLIDFGIARQQQEPASGQLLASAFVGTPQYMSPEQIRGDGTDVRSDVWGAAAVLYEAMAGRPAFVGADVSQIFQAILRDPPAFPAHLRDVDGRLWSILTRGLRKEPPLRQASCGELAAQLRDWLAQPGRGTAMPAKLPPPSPARASASSDAVTLSAVQVRPTGLGGPIDDLMRKKGPRD